MNNEIKDFIRSVRDTLLSYSVVLVIYGFIERFFLPKQTKIIVDDGVPAELVMLGKKDNPKAVYVGTQKHKVNFRGAIVLIAMALCISKFLADYEEKHKVDVIDE